MARADGILQGAPLDALRQRHRGPLLLPGDDGYDAARAVWNGMIDRRPAVIARCRGPADVMAAVDAARTAGLPVSVRGGGHNVGGKAVCDGGVMLDLTAMRWVHVDPERRRARAGGGTLWGDFDHEAQAFGLTCTGGVVSTTGVAGLTLGGGIGYLTRRHGLACDNLLSADLVTADGRLVHASDDRNPELMWALRGGGGNFGVVTSLEFQLHPVGPEVAAAVVFYPIDQAEVVLRRYRTYAEAAPDAIACYAMVVNAPPDLPAEHQGRPVLAIVGCHADDVDAGRELLQPVAGFGRPIAAVIDAMPYTALQTSFDAGNPTGQRYYWKSQHLTGLPDELIDAVCRFARDLHGDFTIIGIEPLGGAQGRVPPDATAFPHRSVPFSLGIWTGWADPAADRDNVAWTRDFFAAVQPFGAGAYVNYLGDDEADRVGEAYGGNMARLVEIKRRWDPDNLFRVNHNIAP